MADNIIIASPATTESDWTVTDPTASDTNPGGALTLQPGDRVGDGTDTVSLLIDTGSAQSFNFLAVPVHTGIATGTVRVRTGVNSAVGDSDDTYNLFPTGFEAIDGFTHHTFFKLYSSAISKRWWRLDFDNDGTAFYFGRVYLCSVTAFDRNYGYGAQEGLIDGGVIQESLGGHLWPGSERGRRRSFAFNLGFASADDRRAAMTLMRRRGVAKDVLVIANPSATEDGQLGIIYGLNTEMRPITNNFLNLYDIGFRVEELLP